MALDIQIVLPAILGAVLAFVWLRSKPFTSQLRGPPSPSWLYGNMQELFLPIPYGKYEFEWQKLYGKAYRLRGCFGSEALVVSDSLALRYIANNAWTFTKPPHIQWINFIGFGSGSLLTAVDEQHRRIRAAMNPVFSAVEVKKVFPTIQKAALDATRRLTAICDDSGAQRSINIYPLLHNITLQAVGESIMGYDFAADETFTKCYENFVVSISKRDKAGLIADAILPRLPRWVSYLLAYFPPPVLAKLLEHRELSTKIAQSVVENKLEEIKLGIEPDGDLIGRLVHSNTNLSEKMSLEEIKDQFGTINAAGEDTTANALSWALFELAGNAMWQSELREEILSHSSDIAQGDYDSLPFLNAFIKETLRYHSPVPLLGRIANADAVIPLSEPIKTRSGKEVTEIFVKKGQQVLGAIQAYHRCTSIWGEDADRFLPSRWLRGDSTLGDGSTIGPYANLVTFWGGPRTCIGWRYAVLEIQVMLCELVRKFSFGVKDAKDIHQSYAITTVPVDTSGKVGLVLLVNAL
ncbi:cytochrome P450 [Cyathus striatus]|nr:cytochrome P450 [Cyathus striatus]